MRRHAVTILAVLAALAVAGCGTREPSDEEQVRATLRALAEGTAKKDYRRLCRDVFSKDLLEGIARIGLPCELAMRRAYDEVEDPRLAIGRVNVDGDRATAEVRSSARGQPPSSDVVTLVREAGKWRVGDLGEAGSPPRAP